MRANLRPFAHSNLELAVEDIAAVALLGQLAVENIAAVALAQLAVGNIAAAAAAVAAALALVQAPKLLKMRAQG
jgi:hypothetical protein